MMTIKIGVLAFVVCVSVFIPTARAQSGLSKNDELKIGWASVDITPSKPVILLGQFHARISESVLDPITATALAIESVKEGKAAQAIMISCDIESISDGTREKANLRNKVRDLLKDLAPALRPESIFINATHTHAAPQASVEDAEKLYGVSLEMMAPGKNAMEPSAYLDFAAVKIASAARQAWNSRKKGGISVGLSKAVIGHNRLQVLQSSKSVMYGNTSSPEFSHIEGYENHDLNLLYTWNDKSQLTGVVINAAVPSQVSEHLYQISADFWHDTRISLREQLGKDLYILSQVSSAGDQSPHFMWNAKAEERMQKLMGFASDGVGRGTISQRKYIAKQITDGVVSILPYMKKNIEWYPVFAHKMENVPLSRRLLGPDDLETAKKDIVKWEQKYKDQLADAKANPEKTKVPRWYRDITISHSQLKRGHSVLERYELEKVSPKLPVEVHVIRIGEAAFASNPFELYLDYGIQIITKSPATQTFLVQLAGSAAYLPTKRSIAGGAYGAVPASTLIGPEGGKELVDATVKLLDSLWK